MFFFLPNGVHIPTLSFLVLKVTNRFIFDGFIFGCMHVWYLWFVGMRSTVGKWMTSCYDSSDFLRREHIISHTGSGPYTKLPGPLCERYKLDSKKPVHYKTSMLDGGSAVGDPHHRLIPWLLQTLMRSCVFLLVVGLFEEKPCCRKSLLLFVARFQPWQVCLNKC